MSHTMTIKTRVVDDQAMLAACTRNQATYLGHGVHKLFEGSRAGRAVKLPGWQYPVVFDTDTGTASFDNYGGKWGDERELPKYLQAYAVEKVKLDAAARGLVVSETPLATGSIELTLTEA